MDWGSVMDSWSSLAKLQKCAKWLRFTCMRKFINAHLPHHVEIIPQRDRTLRLACFKPVKSWEIEIQEAHTSEHPSPDSKMWANGVVVARTSARFVIILCEGEWHHGVLVDMASCVPTLNRTRVGKVKLPWVRQGQYFEVFSTLTDLWTILRDRTDLNE